MKQLRGFQRLTLKPGQSRRVTFDLAAAQLAFYERDGRWLRRNGEREGLPRARFAYPASLRGDRA